MSQIKRYFANAIAAVGIGSAAFGLASWLRTYDTIHRSRIEINLINSRERSGEILPEDAANFRLRAIGSYICADDIVTKIGMYTDMTVSSVLSPCPIDGLLDVVTFPYLLDANRHRICTSTK